MDEKPIDKWEFAQVPAELGTLIYNLRNHLHHIAEMDFLALEGAHEEWLKLYQAGEEISHLAERLDSRYQAQFSAPRQTHYVTTKAVEKQRVRLTQNIEGKNLCVGETGTIERGLSGRLGVRFDHSPLNLWFELDGRHVFDLVEVTEL